MAAWGGYPLIGLILLIGRYGSTNALAIILCIRAAISVMT
jgi:hypothetical protein